MSEMHSVKECFRVGKVKISYHKGVPMEWLIAGLIFAVLAKQGLRKQGKRVDVKAAAAGVAANIVLEAAELLEVEISSISTEDKRS